MSQTVKLGYVPLKDTISGGVTLVNTEKGSAPASRPDCVIRHINRFSNGIVAEMSFDMRGGQVHEIRCKWSKKLNRAWLLPIYEQYVTWRDAAFESVAKEYGLGNMMIVDLPEKNATEAGQG